MTGEQPKFATPFYVTKEDPHHCVCSDKKGQLTKLLSVQQTGCWVHESPPPIPIAMIGVQPRPMRPSMEGRASPSSPLGSLSVVEVDCSVWVVSTHRDYVGDGEISRFGCWCGIACRIGRSHYELRARWMRQQLLQCGQQQDESREASVRGYSERVR